MPPDTPKNSETASREYFLTPEQFKARAEELAKFAQQNLINAWKEREAREKKEIEERAQQRDT